LPTLAIEENATESSECFVNPLGMTMIRIRRGRFARRDKNQNSSVQAVTLTHDFYLCDKEVRASHFGQFINDPNYPDKDKPLGWKDRAAGNDFGASPQDNVSWYDAVLFCNWLSRKERLDPCYERTGKKQKIREELNNQAAEYDAWRIAANGTGYRLPTEAEWEYACRAGTTTDFASGSDVELLRNYAVFNTGSAQGPSGSGTKMPNGWGLFDMHGNVGEWCYDWSSDYGASDASDPTGPSEYPSIGPSYRVVRGGSWNDVALGCRSAFRGRNWPDSRSSGNGFRVARDSMK
jgi:formylglycine-generating enzyme required for sulfatase activity